MDEWECRSIRPFRKVEIISALDNVSCLRSLELCCVVGMSL